MSKRCHQTTVPSHRLPTSDLSQTFGALADPTRRAILARLARGEASVGDLARPFSIPVPAISRHLRVLERARLIERRIDVVRRVSRLPAQPLGSAVGGIARSGGMWTVRPGVPAVL